MAFTWHTGMSDYEIYITDYTMGCHRRKIYTHDSLTWRLPWTFLLNLRSKIASFRAPTSHFLLIISDSIRFLTLVWHLYEFNAGLVCVFMMPLWRVCSWCKWYDACSSWVCSKNFFQGTGKKQKLNSCMFRFGHDGKPVPSAWTNMTALYSLVLSINDIELMTLYCVRP